MTELALHVFDELVHHAACCATCTGGSDGTPVNRYGNIVDGRETWS